MPSSRKGREPKKVEDYRADRAFLDEAESELLEAWDHLVAENERLRRAIEKALQAPEDELRGIPWADLTAALSEAGNTNTSPEPAE